MIRAVLYISIIFLAHIISHESVPLHKVMSDTDRVSEHNPEENSGLEGGDMIFPPFAKSPSERGVAVRGAINRWSGGIIPYEIAANISANHSTFIEAQMRAMENLIQVNNTPCIQFRPKNATDRIFITIFNGSGCYAPVGSWGTITSVRPVSLMHGTFATCMVTGIIQHELTHVLGFFHEQSRPDRDLYVSIQWNNIQPSNAFNFDKYNETDVDTLMTPYDYGSVMHYERTAFAINRSAPTIIPLQNATAYIGQRIQLSPTDILEIQRYYGCVSMPSNVSTTSSSAVTVTTTTSTTTTATTATSATTTSATMTTATTTTSATTTSATTTTATTTTSTTVTTRTTTNSSTRNAFQIYVICLIFYFITIIITLDSP